MLREEKLKGFTPPKTPNKLPNNAIFCYKYLVLLMISDIFRALTWKGSQVQVLLRPPAQNWFTNFGSVPFIRTKTFKRIRCGHAFVGAFRRQFGVWVKTGEPGIVGIMEDGDMVA